LATGSTGCGSFGQNVISGFGGVAISGDRAHDLISGVPVPASAGPNPPSPPSERRAFRDGIAACLAGCLNLANYGYNAGRELGRLRPAGLGLNGPDPVSFWLFRHKGLPAHQNAPATLKRDCGLNGGVGRHWPVFTGIGLVSWSTAASRSNACEKPAVS
jgi:hypothetical protein